MSSGVDKLIEVMKKLRNPNGGCPWDCEQTTKTLAPYTIEEAYEVVEAIEAGDDTHLKEELGDLLLQIVFHAQIASETGRFDIDQIAETEADKMIDRHPHVFGDRDGVKTGNDVLKNWEADKAAKREKQAKDEGRAQSALDGVSPALPAMTRATKLQQRAARVGFDWEDGRDIIAKLHEEADELHVEMQAPDLAANKDRIEEELGDLLFVIVNLARRLKIDPEHALRLCNRKFERRFKGIESTLAEQGLKMTDVGLAEMDKIWNEIKKAEKNQ